MVNTRTMYIPTMNIIEQGEALKTVKTFLKAIKGAGLDALLRGAGPFTVFAPDDEAFYAMAQVLVRDLLDSQSALDAFVRFHILPGKKVMSGDVVSLQSAATLRGDTVTFNFNTRRGFLVNDVPVVAPDIECSNGVIHVISALLAPHTR